MNVSGDFTMTGGQISADAIGYPTGSPYSSSYGPSGPSTALGSLSIMANRLCRITAR